MHWTDGLQGDLVKSPILGLVWIPLLTYRFSEWSWWRYSATSVSRSGFFSGLFVSQPWGFQALLQDSFPAINWYRSIQLWTRFPDCFCFSSHCALDVSLGKLLLSWLSLRVLWPLPLQFRNYSIFWKANLHNSHINVQKFEPMGGVQEGGRFIDDKRGLMVWWKLVVCKKYSYIW